MHICKVFKLICSKVYDLSKYQNLRSSVIYSLCFLEKVPPPTFFNLMTHLVGLDLCRPMHTHWMYSIELAMEDLKGYIRIVFKLNGNMVEGYIIDEALGLCM